MADFAHELTLQMPRLRRYARALTGNVSWADDLVQDTLERALRRRWLFRLNSNLSAWLYTMLYRLYLNQSAHRRSVPMVPEADAPEPLAPGEPGLQLDMQRALDRLSAEHRAVIVLIGLEQFSYKEAALLLGVPVGTVMSRLARGREQLRCLLSDTPGAPAASPPNPAALVRIK